MAKAKKAKGSKVVKGPQGKLPLRRKTDPGHYTEKGTRKYQTNGPQVWAKEMARIAKAAGKEREGEGIRMALAFAMAQVEKVVAWSKANQATAVKGEA